MNMNTKWFLLSFMIVSLLSATACTPVQSPGADEPKTSSTPDNGQSIAPEAAQKAVDLLAKELNLANNLITIQTVKEVQWRDACLELAAAEEMCAAVITPGYQVILETGGKTYEYHTDRSGDVVRRAPLAEMDDIGSLAVRKLAELAGLPVESIQLVGYEAVEWPNGCLGAGELNEACLDVIVSGYRFDLEAGGRAYTLHTDQSLSQARLGGPEETLVIVKVRKQAAVDRNVALTEVELVSSERVQWRDSCLGIERKGQMCLMVITPGFRILVRAGGTQLEYHTNQAGTAVAFYKP